MEVIQAGTTSEGYPVYLDKHASQADHIGVVARVKPHTSFHGPIESGLMKMMMIGLGKHAGALTYHRLLLDHPYDPVVRSVGRLMRAKGKIAFGLGLVENAYDETLVEAALPGDFEQSRSRLAWLMLAAAAAPAEADRHFDEIGKEISGSAWTPTWPAEAAAFPGRSPRASQRCFFSCGAGQHTR
jgi:hypothetical protein